MSPLKLSLAISLVGLTLGCGASLDAMGDTAFLSQDIEPIGPVVIQSISPNWGPSVGGTSVQISGVGFEGRVRVYFGNAELSVTKTDASTVLVTSPNAGGPATVDVRLTSDLGEDSVTGGFTFSDSGPPPNTGGPTDTGPTQGTGLVGGVLELNRTQVACPSCLGYASEMTVSVGAAFHAPAPVSWNSWLPPIGGCAINPANLPPVPSYIDPGEWAFLSSGNTAIALQREQGQRGPVLAADNRPVSDYISNASYNFRLDGSGPLGAFTLNGAIQSADGFNAISPIEMLYSDPASAFTAPFSSAGTTVSWSPAGSGTDFVIDLGVYDSVSGAYIGQLTCHAADTGQFFIPLGSFITPPALLSVSMTRRLITERVIPANGATLQAISSSTVIGTASMAY